MNLGRRKVLAGIAAGAAIAAVPLVNNGLTSFFNRTLRAHFGDDVTEIAGIDAFVSDYAATVARDDFMKRSTAQVYFAMRGDRIQKIGIAQELENRFLQTILTRSNIIAIRQKKANEFEYTDADPWELACGSYLTDAADLMG